MQLSHECYRFYKLSWDAKIPLEPVALMDARFQQNSMPNHRPDTKQYQALDRFLKICDALKSRVYARENISGEDVTAVDYSRFKKALTEEFNAAIADTEEEQKLVTVYAMQPVFYEHYSAAGRVKTDLPQMNAEVQQELYAELASIGQELSQLKDQEGQEKNIEALRQRRDEVLAILMEEQPIDVEQPGGDSEKQQIIGDFVQYANDVKAVLNTPYPDSFEMALKLLEFRTGHDAFIYDVSKLRSYKIDHGLIDEYVSPAHQLQQIAGINHDGIFMASLSAASNLYMCYLGDDCSADSKFIRRYCLGIPFDPVTYPEACDMDLVSFYTDVLLTENQQLDVFLLLDYMIESYEQ